jgi:hypothetical protein
MRWSTISSSALAALLLAPLALSAQDLVPRAYVITPAGSNAVILSYARNSGDLVFDSSVQIDNGSGTFQTPVLSYYHSLSLLGRSANVVVAQPYAVGNFQGEVGGVLAKVYRSGLIDTRVRFSVNLRGGPAMGLKEFAEWREKTLIGASLTTVVPLGQYDPARIINPGTNRWAFKPEIGFSRRWRRWVVEAYGGVWLFTKNPNFFPGQSVRTQRPMAAFEAHLDYYLKPRLWVSLDTNFWNGGRSSTNGVEKQDGQRNSRAGLTFSTPISRHQSLKFSYSRGTYVTIGGNFQSIAIAWQYSWLGNPR